MYTKVEEESEEEEEGLYIGREGRREGGRRGMSRRTLNNTTSYITTGPTDTTGVEHRDGGYTTLTDGTTYMKTARPLPISGFNFHKEMYISQEYQA